MKNPSLYKDSQKGQFFNVKVSLGQAGRQGLRGGGRGVGERRGSQDNSCS